MLIVTKNMLVDWYFKTKKKNLTKTLFVNNVTTEKENGLLKNVQMIKLYIFANGYFRIFIILSSVNNQRTRQFLQDRITLIFLCYWSSFEVYRYFHFQNYKSEHNEYFMRIYILLKSFVLQTKKIKPSLVLNQFESIICYYEINNLLLYHRDLWSTIFLITYILSTSIKHSD